MLKKLKEADKSFYKSVMTSIVIWLVIGIIGIILVGTDLYFLFAGLILALVAFFDYIIAGFFYFIAVDKGYKDTIYLRLGYFIPPIGHLLIIAMPDRANTVAKSVDVDELPEL
ncbi:MAG: hypothetical protein NC110_07170 [Ruminococcus sp.]|nr:hypothetical protein [Ruminococcus sp.]